MSSDTVHSEFHRDKMVSNLIQLQDHLREYSCPECMDKHALSTVAYMEEEMATNPNANPELMALAERVREIRRRIQEMNDVKMANSQKRLGSIV